MAEGLRMLRDNMCDTWRETAHGSGRFILWEYADGEVPTTPVSRRTSLSETHIREDYGPLTEVGTKPTERSSRTLHQHAAAIALALADAAADGYGVYDPVHLGVPRLDLIDINTDRTVFIDVPRAEGEAKP